ncbi:MAG: nucleotidyltransferase domain-containing protein [Dermatophilaceae bacterium]
MDVSNGLSVVTPTLDAWVLRALAQTTRPLSGRQIARLVQHGSLGGVQKALARLVEQGIVLADAHPAATLFTFNRDHLAARPVVELAQLASTLVERLKGLIRSWQVQPQHAYLFGSAARQDGDASSDVDILLVHAQCSEEHVNAWTQQVDDLGAKIRLWTGNDAGILDISAVDLERMQVNAEAILDSWQREGIVLAGADLANRRVALR